MKRSALLLFGLLASLTVQAQIYQYKDAAGKTVYSDQPPIGGGMKAKTVSGETPANSANPVQKSTADRELDFKKRQQEQKEAADKSQKEAADKAARAEDCANARRQLQILESGERVSSRDDKGERVFMEDSQRTAEITRTRKYISDSCK
jgi:hypothetical protein